MKPMDLDPSLAFTALLELDFEHTKRTVAESATMRQQLLQAFYAQEEVRNLFDFTRQWLAEREEA